MISVIVPVYNAEKYLPEALESVFSQSYTDWELILVDDGSTDSSSVICDATASSNPKVKVVHKTNGGLSSARNAGLDIAEGDFIFFLDADDILPSDALESLTVWQEHSKADIICGKIKKFSSLPVSINSKTSHISPTIYSPAEAVETILYQKNLDNSAWGKLYAARLWKENRFREGTYYEDLDVFYKIFFMADKILKIEDIVYFYRQHEESYVHTFKLGRKDMLSVTHGVVDYMKQHNPGLLKAALSRQLSANFNMLLLIAANKSSIKDEEREEAEKIADNCWKKIKELRKYNLFNPKVRLKNKAGIVLSYIGGRPLLELSGKFTY